ncbi:MAG: Vanadium chloroperoxidase N-terminal domain [Actinomycetia bacterium]|jgi:hypothetical protein|nr:Vanadium chloroperoxidase N-terminal domain [Actinomycetes bacterium]
MRNRLLAGRAATAGLAALLTLATLVAVRTPVAASGAERIPARSDNVVLLWNEAALQAVRDTRPAPTVTARALAVVHASITMPGRPTTPRRSAAASAAACGSHPPSAPRPTSAPPSATPPTEPW